MPHPFLVDSSSGLPSPGTPRERACPRLAIVVPCFNEEEVLPETVARLCGQVNRMKEEGGVREDSAIVFVDDGSRDRTWDLISDYAGRIPGVHGMKLSRNRGHQNALLAGLHHVAGDAVISVDADLQDDIEKMSDMVDAYREGAEIVYGVRNARETDGWFKRWTAENYYRLLNRMGVELVHNHADFRLLGRQALDALKEYGEVNLFLRGVIPTLGFPSATVEYARRARMAGESKYPLFKMIALAAQGVTSFSPIPLRLIAGLGFLVSFASLCLMVWALVVRIFNADAVPGWASSVIPIYFIGGIQLLSVGVVGEYISKIYLETKRRPRFVVERFE